MSFPRLSAEALAKVKKRELTNMKNNIAIIGGGNMGEALIKGLHKTHAVYVVEANLDRAAFLKKKYRLTITDVPIAVKHAGVIVLAVKPQDMATALSVLSFPRSLGAPGMRVSASVGNLNTKLFISIAAGLTTKFFEKAIGGKPRVIRSMPNMPALIGQGITGIAAGKHAKAQDIKTAQTILKSIGQTVIVNEAMLDAVTAVSGSGPAYVFLFVEQWMAAAKELGFNDVQAKDLVYKTLLGSAHLLEQSEFSAGTLREKVTSKGGTTQAALEVFARGKFDQLIKKALLAAKNRAKELSM